MGKPDQDAAAAAGARRATGAAAGRGSVGANTVKPLSKNPRALHLGKGLAHQTPAVEQTGTGHAGAGTHERRPARVVREVDMYVGKNRGHVCLLRHVSSSLVESGR